MSTSSLPRRDRIPGAAPKSELLPQRPKYLTMAEFATKPDVRMAPLSLEPMEVLSVRSVLRSVTAAVPPSVPAPQRMDHNPGTPELSAVTLAAGNGSIVLLLLAGACRCCASASKDCAVSCSSSCCGGSSESSPHGDTCIRSASCGSGSAAGCRCRGAAETPADWPSNSRSRLSAAAPNSRCSSSRVLCLQDASCIHARTSTGLAAKSSDSSGSSGEGGRSHVMTLGGKSLSSAALHARKVQPSAVQLNETMTCVTLSRLRRWPPCCWLRPQI
mmetsp:Transcript_39271/g.113527  ORF Transcript_39271/g.113527 Transcript_39271/m.113527 type:complete len:273 (+) Transcript_39271:2690-3508(+)